MTDMPAGEIFALFRRIFGGRKSPYTLHSITLSGRPVSRRVCRSCRGTAQGRADCARCRGGKFCELSAEDIMGHINGRAAVGIYPSDESGLCRFCVVEVGGEAPAETLRLMAEVCRALSVSFLAEISGYGRCGRLWIFFGRDVSPEAAVFAALRIIEEAVPPELQPSLLDGILPLPSGGAGFGKSVVLPLFDIDSGFSFFLDGDFEPVEDGLAFLEDFRPDGAAFSFPPADFPSEIGAEVCGSVYLRVGDFSRRALAELCRAACFINPDCGEFSDEPPIARCFSVSGGRLILPRCTPLRGLMPDTKIHITRSGSKGRKISLRLKFSLNPWQRRGAEELLKHENGVLTAPVGSGKTLIICALLEKLGRSALILVPDRAAALRWKRRLLEAFGLDGDGVGCVIGDRDYPNGLLDVAVFNEKTELLLAEYISLYGTVIVADCDRLNCSGGVFRSVMEAVCAERVYALSARPAEGVRLRDYVRLYCGETIYKL